MIKKTIPLILVILLILSTSINAFALEKSSNKLNNTLFTNEQIKEDLDILCVGITRDMITSIDFFDNEFEYTIDFDGDIEKAVVTREQKGIHIITTASERRDDLLITNTGKMFLDGTEIKITTFENDANPFSKPLKLNSSWKAQILDSPYGSLTDSSYSNILVSSKKQNIALGKTMDKITANSLSAILARTNPYVALGMKAVKKAADIRDTVNSLNPKTEYLGSIYETRTCGEADYRFKVDYYADAKCSKAKYAETDIFYAHYIIY